MNNVNRRLVTLAVVGVFVFSIIQIGNFVGQKHHFEAEYPEKLTGSLVQLNLVGLQDCNLTISFVNDTSLMYSMDVELASPTFMGSVFRLTREVHSWICLVDFIPLVPIRSLQLVLGTGKYYYLGILSGTNLTSTVTYSNGAVSGREFRYEATGTLWFTFLEDVSISTGEFLVEVMTNVTYVYVNLPPWLNGVFDSYTSGGTAVVNHDGGWFNRTDNTLGTIEGYSEPLLSISVLSTTIIANLYG